MTAAIEMSAPAQSQKATPQRTLDEHLATLRENARAFARLDAGKKADLLQEVMAALEPLAPQWVADGCRAKRIAPVSASAGEEWLAGPMVTMRNLRLLVRSLRDIAARGKPALDDRQLVRRPDGRLEVRVFPTSAMDGALFAGFTAHQLMAAGMGVDEVRARQAEFYGKKEPEGGVSLILGAGNVSSIPPMDYLYKAIAEGHVALIKMNPVNEWVGPHLERAFKPLIDAGFLRVAYGGGDVGSYLVRHDAVTDVHITGSNHTHDLIVWGPPGPERERRKAARDPLLRKTITSELGNVSPIAIVPAEYSDGELDFLARNLVTMVANNGSFNCNAGKLIISSSGWPQRRALLDRMAQIFEATPTRYAYYPGAADRYRLLTEGHAVRKLGTPAEGHLPWTMILDADAQKKDEIVFSMEPFCTIISETTLEAREPAAFLAEATRFMNDRVWGTLNATIVVHPRHEQSAEVGATLEQSIRDLRYGTVAINHWPALAYGFVSAAWGGHPSSTLEDIQSGLGWVHNTYLLEGIEKTVVRGPLTVFPKPPWFIDHKKTHVVGRRMFDLERAPNWLKVPGVALAAIGG